MGLFGAHRRVGRSCWILAICRLGSSALRNPRILENLQIAHPSTDCADPANAPNRRAGRLMKIVCISSSDRTFKITIGILTGKNLNYPIVSSTYLNILIIITSNTRLKITFRCHFNRKPRGVMYCFNYTIRLSYFQNGLSACHFKNLCCLVGIMAVALTKYFF